MGANTIDELVELRLRQKLDFMGGILDDGNINGARRPGRGSKRERGTGCQRRRRTAQPPETMSMPRTVIVAIGRWLDLLSKTGFVRANALVHNDAAYTDITPTQYATALEWLWTVTDIRQSG